MADIIGKKLEPENEEQAAAKERLNSLQKQIEEIIKAHQSNYTFLIAIHEDSSHMTIYTGNGCPVCMVNRCMVWVLENNLQHDSEETESANITIDLGKVFGKMPKLKKTEIN